MLKKSFSTSSKTKIKPPKLKQQYKLQSQINDEIKLQIYLSKDESINLQIPINCPLKMINSLLIHKVSHFKKQQLIGFQSVPQNYILDYRLKNNIGILRQNNDLSLLCLYKNSAVEEMIKEKENKQKQNIYQSLSISSFYKINKYKLCKSLSSGGFSRVYLVRSLLNGNFYAAKFMDKSSQVNIDRQDSIQNQFLVHKSLKHPYIVQMEEYIETQEFYILIMEYCPGGELFTLLKNNRYMEEQKAQSIFIQILLAIKYLHDQHIIFRDIKPENILIDAQGNAKLTDFGLAKKIRGKTNSYCGSVQYMAPQIVAKKNYYLQVDLYCMGALLYEILVGCPPFYNPNFSNNQTKFHICNSEVCFPQKVILSEQVRDLICGMLVKRPEHRNGHQGGVNQILQHPWFEGADIQQFLKTQIECPFIPNLQLQNFDRQDDPFQSKFRQKIQQDMKHCKRQYAASNVNKRFKFNPQIKQKSQSVGFCYKKHSKTKSQGQYPFCMQSQQRYNNVSRLKVNKQDEIMNPYQYTLTKSISLFHSSPKNKNHLSPNIRDYQYRSKQKKRIQSRSKNNSISEQNKLSRKQSLNDTLIVNNKSYLHSRSNSKSRSLFKNSDKNNKIDFSKVKNMKSLSKKINDYKESQVQKVLQVGRNSFNTSKHRFSMGGEEQFKENCNDKKQLKRKHIKDKSKFQFSSSIKQGMRKISKNYYSTNNSNFATPFMRQSVHE